MKRQFFVIAITIFLLIFLVCCKREDNVISEDEFSPPEKLLDAITSTPYLIETPIPSQAVEVNSEESGNCNENDISSFENIELHGTMVFYKKVDLSKSNLLFIDQTSKEEVLLENLHIDNILVSPEGGYLAYLSHDFINDEPKNYEINIVDNIGASIDKIMYEKYWLGFDWFTEDSIMVNYTIDGYPVMLLNLYSGDRNILNSYESESSVFIYDEIIRDWGIFSYNKNVYDTSLTRVLYPSSDQNGPYVVLRDLEDNIDLTFLPTHEKWGIHPNWSSGNEMLAIAINTNEEALSNGINEYEIYIIDKNGKLLYQSDLNNQYNNVYIDYLNWSPNNRFIAFLYSTDYFDRELFLGLLNVEEKNIQVFCLNTSTNRPKWSPDSNYLLIGQKSGNNGDESTVMLNIFSGEITTIKSDYLPVGWMK